MADMADMGWTTRRGSEHPRLGRRTPHEIERFFDSGQLEARRAHYRPLRTTRRINRVFSEVLDLILIFGVQLYAWVAHGVDAHWTLQLVAVIAVANLIGELVGLPRKAWESLVYLKRAGTSTTTVGTFVKDQLVGFVMDVALMSLLLVPIWWAIREVDAWWIIGGGAFLVLNAFMAFVYPVVFMPRFNKFTPMPEGEVRDRIEAIAELAGVSIEGVYTMDGSKRTTAGNAFVAGLGPTKRVVVYDTVMDWPLDELSQVVAHEIGHYRLNHIVQTFPFSGLKMLVTLGFCQLVLETWDVPSWVGARSLGDPAALPLLVLAFTIPTTVLQLASTWLSRRHEREADLEALELLGQPSSFVRLWPRIAEQGKAELESPVWERLNGSHPEIAERMQFALDWAALNGVPAEAPPPQTVPEADLADAGGGKAALG